MNLLGQCALYSVPLSRFLDSSVKIGSDFAVKNDNSIRDYVTKRLKVSIILEWYLQTGLLLLGLLIGISSFSHCCDKIPHQKQLKVHSTYWPEVWGYNLSWQRRYGGRSMTFPIQHLELESRGTNADSLWYPVHTLVYGQLLSTCSFGLPHQSNILKCGDLNKNDLHGLRYFSA